jgi:hypothetical protein
VSDDAVRSYEEFLEADDYEITDSELWQHTPRLLETVAASWGKPLDANTKRAMWLLNMAQMDRAAVVMAVIALDKR